MNNKLTKTEFINTIAELELDVVTDEEKIESWNSEKPVDLQWAVYNKTEKWHEPKDEVEFHLYHNIDALLLPSGKIVVSIDDTETKNKKITVSLIYPIDNVFDEKEVFVTSITDDSSKIIPEKVVDTVKEQANHYGECLQKELYQTDEFKSNKSTIENEHYTVEEVGEDILQELKRIDIDIIIDEIKNRYFETEVQVDNSDFEWVLRDAEINETRYKIRYKFNLSINGNKETLGYLGVHGHYHDTMLGYCDNYDTDEQQFTTKFFNEIEFSISFAGDSLSADELDVDIDKDEFDGDSEIIPMKWVDFTIDMVNFQAQYLQEVICRGNTIPNTIEKLTE